MTTWFRWPERLVLFTLGLVFSKGLMTYVLTNLMTFLTDFWNLKLKEAALIVNLQDGLRNMLQIYVVLCIDACFGYRWMLILSSLVYSAGLFLLAFSVPEYFLQWLLNNAAVKEYTTDDNLRAGKRTWRLCTVREVEQTKLLLDIIPMSATFLVYGMVKSLGDTFFVEQAGSMRGDIPVVGLQLIQHISKNVVSYVYEKVLDKRIQRIERHYSDGVKIGIGMLASITCCAVASSTESKRLKALRENGLLNDPKAKAPISNYWLIPQFFLLGAMEGLAGDGFVDFFAHYAPDSRRYGPVFTSSLTGFGIILNIGFIAILDYCSGQLGRKNNWFGDSINESRLDLIYRAYVLVAFLNCFLYAYVSSSYSYDNIIGKPEDEEEIPFLEVKEEETATENQEQMTYQLHHITVR